MSKQRDFYDARYSNERQKLRDTVFAEVYESYFGQSSWVSTADYDRFSDSLALNSTSRLLDIACGSGQPSLRIAERTGCTVTGIDFSESAIATATAAKLAQEKTLSSRVLFLHADAGRPLQFSDASFDAVMCVDALAHLPDRRRIFSDWARILKPGGQLMFTDQVLTGQISNHEVAARMPFGYTALGPEGYNERLLEECGFALLKKVDLTSTLAKIAEGHCAARKKHHEALRSTEGEHEFESQNQYRATAAQLARERRLSHLAYLAARTPTSNAI